MSDRSQPAPVGERIHMPGPSVQPALVAVALTLLLVGLSTKYVLTIAGGVLLVLVSLRWIADTRRDIAELPLEH